MLNPTIDPEVKYLYLRDPWCEQRVLTLGRKFIQGKLYFSWALNKVERSKIAHECHGYRPQWVVYDRFDKKTARHIVCQRMQREDRRNVVTIKEGQTPIAAVLETLSRAWGTTPVEGQAYVPWRIASLVSRVLAPGAHPNPYPAKPSRSPRQELWRDGTPKTPPQMVGEQFSVTSTAALSELRKADG
jgi:hypothetical protein